MNHKTVTKQQRQNLSIEPLAARALKSRRESKRRATELTLKRLRKVLWLTVFLALAIFVWGLLWSDYRSDQANAQNDEFRANFELTNHEGMVQTQEDFTGKLMLIFFGFANCPDVCPTTLSEVSAVMEMLGEGAKEVQPLFISIDPERDTPAKLAEFVPQFDTGIIGLSGTPEQTALTAKNFYIFYEKIEEAQSPDGYTMGHSSQLFLFGPDSEYIKSWQYGTTAEEIYSNMKDIIN